MTQYFRGKTREEILTEGMCLWDRLAKPYRELPQEYERLRAEKVRLRISPVGVVKRESFANLPKIDFFEITERQKAVEMLQRMHPLRAAEMLEKIHDILDYNYAYRNITAYLRDARYKIYLREQGVAAYSMKASGRHIKYGRGACRISLLG